MIKPIFFQPNSSGYTVLWSVLSTDNCLAKSGDCLPTRMTRQTMFSFLCPDYLFVSHNLPGQRFPV